MAELKLTMALSHYDRHIPFFDGTVVPEGIHLTVLQVGQSSPLRHGVGRHERIIQKGEFDIGELSHGKKPGHAAYRYSGLSAQAF
ncbi:MAG: hypothetical protein ACREQA_11055 [Candidatus Binatia bacterium]